jgi:chemotaxis receptor (MCP) glutamine deamidase CheD
MNRKFLLPGQWCISQGNELISTVLGSCVSIILFDSITKWSAMTHYLFPEYMPGRNQEPSGRYGDVALDLALKALGQKGVHQSNLKAKIYGGANMSQGNSIGEAIGASNIVFAVQNLAGLGIPVVDENLGGFKSRKITFDTTSFSVIHELNEKVA